MSDAKDHATERRMIGQIVLLAENFTGSGRRKHQRAVLSKSIHQIHALLDIERFINRQAWTMQSRFDGAMIHEDRRQNEGRSE